MRTEGRDTVGNAVSYSKRTSLILVQNGEPSIRVRVGQIDLESALDQGVEVNLHLPALIPDDYLSDVNMRLTLYKRLSNCQTKQDLHELQVEMIDRFGLLPEPVKALFEIAEHHLGKGKMK